MLMNFKNARELFLGAHDKVFLDSACVGLAPNSARIAIEKFLDMAVNCHARDVSEHHIAMDAMKQQAAVEAALLFNTHIDNISLIESTTHGLNIAANSIPFSQHDEVIICDVEYLQVAIPFVKKHEKLQLKVVQLKTPPDGILRIEDFAKAITDNTKAICVSSVQWCTGQRVFSKELGELCRNRNIWLIVDGVQEAGALSVDMSERYCDFYVAGGHKWLNAPYGCGVMFLSKRAQELEPPGYGYLNLSPPFGGWGKFFQTPTQTPFRAYDFPKNAPSFGIGGTGNYPGAIGLCESIKIVNHIGTKNVEERVLELGQFLREHLEKAGAKFAPSSYQERSGICIFRLFDSYEQDLLVLDELLTKRIFLSLRYTNGHGGLRASTHYYNNEEDILRLCFELERIKNSKR